MSLSDDYRRQFAWRDWPRVLRSVTLERPFARIDPSRPTANPDARETGATAPADPWKLTMLPRVRPAPK